MVQVDWGSTVPAHSSHDRRGHGAAGKKWFADTARTVLQIVIALVCLLGGIGNPEPLPELPPQERSYWRHREFIWGPEYVDELILQQEVRPEGASGPAHGPAMYAIVNLGYDVVALADAAGVVLRQYTFDPYGRVVEAHSLADHAPNRVGHKGLFFGRLDGPAQGPQLVAYARGVYHCRNRELRPDLQRWMQQDPWGSGSPVQYGLPSHGMPMFVASPAVGDLFVDGLNLASYVRGEPVRRADPRGLFLGLPGQAAMMGINAWGAASDSLETARMGIVMGFGLLESLAQYQLETTVDAAWATDWEYEDFDYFAGGITDASYGRMYTFSGAVHEPESEADGPAQAGQVHGNSLSSRRTNYVYEITYVPTTGENKGKVCTYKYGVTSSALVTTKKHGGVPKRVAMQLRKLERRGMKPVAQIVEEFKSRRKAINNEALKINAAKSRGERLPGNKRIPRIR